MEPSSGYATASAVIAASAANGALADRARSLPLDLADLDVRVAGDTVQGDEAAVARVMRRRRMASSISAMTSSPCARLVRGPRQGRRFRERARLVRSRRVPQLDLALGPH